jgi:Leucine-rich repeat (LRR) protein
MSTSNAKAIQLKCKYFNGRCDVETANFTKESIGELFEFTGSQVEKKATNSIKFCGIGQVAHLPENLFQQFPKLSTLSIRSSKIPIVRDNFFTSEFSQIKYLSLISDQIKMIEDQVFTHFINLVEIYLEKNEIQSISEKLFERNGQLKVIYLAFNKIKMIDSTVFKIFSHLEYVGLHENECVYQDSGCWGACKINHTELNHKLKDCYDNYERSLDFLNEGGFSNILVK